MNHQERARILRPMIEKASASLSDEDALVAVELFHIWMPDTHYTKPVRVRDPEDGFLYRLIPDTHDSQESWPPRLVPAVWTRVDEPGEEWPEWRQPIGSQDAYMTGDKVRYPDTGGDIYVSTIDNNVWEPGVYGWEVVET